VYYVYGQEVSRVTSRPLEKVNTGLTDSVDRGPPRDARVATLSGRAWQDHPGG
jgi:hypothetical protein